MDPITLIVTALAAGVGSGITDDVSSAVKDAYQSLKALVTRRLGNRPDAGLVLARHEQAPDTWREPLVAELEQAGADHDPDLLAAAQTLMRLIDEAGERRGKYAIDLHGAQGVQVGDANEQHNVFNSPPGALAPPDLTHDP